ncbi:hypothetical protein RJ640_000775 [Escallonia rubra]|uniref:PGG domain-containing protein n=1 Tax=Escallonia rubra TaxID=112253 RepID=A0AA88UWR9_9ASTE|nr:hypothetical protein RJ640_000775 [Escallonia rubra]
MLLPEAIIMEKMNIEQAWSLAKFLISKDVSSENTGSTSLSDGESLGKPHQADLSTLLLAAKSGNAEIVEVILRRFPHAVENIDGRGRNILHVAIQYHHIRVLDIVEKMEFPMPRLVRNLDRDGNSILHMVGIKTTDDKLEDMQTPALLLQENLLLFERVNAISNREFIRLHNNAGKTAEELFVENNAQLRENAKEWLKRTAENCSIVAVLIATVAFAAAFTVPGGPNQDTGYPILRNKRLFILFTVADVISLTSALTSVILFLLILTSPFRLKDFKQSLPKKLMLGVTLLIVSVSAMMLAFVAAVILQIRSKDQWMEFALYSIAFFPVTIFIFSSFRFYASLMKSFGYSLNQ